MFIKIWMQLNVSCNDGMCDDGDGVIGNIK